MRSHAAARVAGVRVRVVIEVDIGMQRAGVASPEACAALSRERSPDNRAWLSQA